MHVTNAHVVADNTKEGISIFCVVHFAIKRSKCRLDSASTDSKITWLSETGSSYISGCMGDAVKIPITVLMF